MDELDPPPSLMRAVSARDMTLQTQFSQAQDEAAQIASKIAAVDDAVRKSGVLSPLQRTQRIVHAISRMRALESVGIVALPSSVAAQSPPSPANKSPEPKNKSPELKHKTPELRPSRSGSYSLASISLEAEQLRAKVQELELHLTEAEAKLKSLTGFYRDKEELWKRLLRKKDEQLIISMSREKELTRVHQERIGELRKNVDYGSKAMVALNCRSRHFEKVIGRYQVELGYELAGEDLELPPEAVPPPRPDGLNKVPKVVPTSGPRLPAARGEEAAKDAARLTQQLLEASTTPVTVEILHKPAGTPPLRRDVAGGSPTREVSSGPADFTESTRDMLAALSEKARSVGERAAVSRLRAALQSPESADGSGEAERPAAGPVSPEPPPLALTSQSAGSDLDSTAAQTAAASERVDAERQAAAPPAQTKPAAAPPPTCTVATQTTGTGPPAAVARAGRVSQAFSPRRRPAPSSPTQKPNPAAPGAQSTSGQPTDPWVEPTESRGANVGSSGAAWPPGPAAGASDPEAPPLGVAAAAGDARVVPESPAVVPAAAVAVMAEDQLSGHLSGSHAPVEQEAVPPLRRGVKQFDFARISRSPQSRSMPVPVGGSRPVGLGLDAVDVVRHITRDDVIGNCVRDLNRKQLHGHRLNSPIRTTRDPPPPRVGVAHNERPWAGGGAGGPLVQVLKPVPPPSPPGRRGRQRQKDV